MGRHGAKNASGNSLYRLSSTHLLDQKCHPKNVLKQVRKRETTPKDNISDNLYKALGTSRF